MKVSLRMRLLVLVTAVAGIALFILLYRYLVPTSALRMRVFRPQAMARASDFVRQQQVRIPPGYRQVASFTSDSYPKAYLEQTLGLARANQVAQEQGFVYAWYVRWFRPGEQEELSVRVDPDGRVIGFAYSLPDDAPAPPSARAEQVAREFVRAAAGVDVAGYELKRSATTPRARRTDIGFTWERPHFKLGEATQRVSVSVTGDRVIGYSRYLFIPEAFGHRYQREQEKGNLLANLAGAASAVFLVAMVVLFVMGAARRELRWRTALVPAALVSAVMLVTQLNSLPLAYAAFPTNKSDISFWMGQVVGMAMSLVGLFFLTALLVLGAEWVYRRTFPQHPVLHTWFSRAGLGSGPGRRRLLLGYWLITLQLGYVGVFYFLADRLLGAWGPSASRYDDLFGTAVPWIYALLIGVTAAISEEFIFRVVAISWLKRVLKRDWLAVLIPAVIWGFAHCSYPNKPFYIRGIEVTVWGVVFGYIFLRYGPLPSLLSHAGYNAVAVGSVFLSSVTWLPKLSFVVVLVLVASPLALSWWWGRRRQEEPAATNQGLAQALGEEVTGEPAPRPLEQWEPPYRPLSRRQWGLSALALALGLTLAGGVYLASRAPARYPWRKVSFHPLRARYVGRGQAVAIARRALPPQARVRGWVLSATPGASGLGEHQRAYLRQFLAETDLAALAARTDGWGSTWTVRWQKPLARESWQVWVRVDSKVVSVMHSLPEEAPGPTLAYQPALALAQEELQRRGVDLGHYRLTGDTKYDYPHRRSYRFTWEPQGLKVARAEFLTEAGVEGSLPEIYSRYVRVPDSFIFARSRQTAWRGVGEALLLVSGLALLGWLVGLYITDLRHYRGHWRWSVQVSAVVITLLAAVALLLLPSYWAGVSDTVPPAAYLALVLVGMGVALMIFGVALATGLPFLVPKWRDHFPTRPGPGYWLGALTRPRRYLPQWREAVLGLVGVIGLLVAAGAALRLLAHLLGPTPNSVQVTIPGWLASLPPQPAAAVHTGLSAASPPLLAICLALAAALLGLLLYLSSLPYLKQMLGGPRWVAVGYLWLGLLSISQAPGWREAVLGGAGWVAFGLAGLGAYRLVIRENPLVLFVGMLAGTSLGEAWALLPFPAHRVGAILIVAVWLGVLLWALGSALLALRHKPQAGREEP